MPAPAAAVMCTAGVGAADTPAYNMAVSGEKCATGGVRGRGPDLLPLPPCALQAWGLRKHLHTTWQWKVCN